MISDISSAQNVGNRLLWFRKFLKMSQKDFAASIGVAPSNLSNWERGHQRLSHNEAIKIATLYNISLDFLYLDRRDALRADMLADLAQQGFNDKETSLSSD